MSEITETEIKAMTKLQNYMRGYKDGKSDVLDKIRAEILVLDDADYDFEGYYKAVTDALKIIDKYKAESPTDTWSIKEVANTLKKHGLIVEQEPKTGHWVEENINEYSRKVFCSECGCPPPFEYVSDGDVYSASGHGVINKTKYCPNCGADMRGE